MATTSRTTHTTPRPAAETATPSAATEARKSLLASVGAADLAVEKLLGLPAVYTTEIRRFSDRVTDISTQAQRLPANAATVVRAIPTTLTSQIVDLQGRATALYEAFAERGERRVASIRREPATEEAIAQTKTAVSRTKAARTSSRKAAEAIGKAVAEAAPDR